MNWKQVHESGRESICGARKEGREHTDNVLLKDGPEVLLLAHHPIDKTTVIATVVTQSLLHAVCSRRREDIRKALLKFPITQSSDPLIEFDIPVLDMARGKRWR